VRIRQHLLEPSPEVKSIIQSTATLPDDSSRYAGDESSLVWQLEINVKKRLKMYGTKPDTHDLIEEVKVFDGRFAVIRGAAAAVESLLLMQSSGACTSRFCPSSQMQFLCR
jgi:hypothetical protein